MTSFSLGRRVNHDPRSRNFAVAPAATEIKSVLHRISSPVLDQQNTSSCTGNAMAQCLSTVAFSPSRKLVKSGYLVETDALALYSAATALDGAPGTYPPDDTGSDGMSVCKAAVNKGYLTGYRHAFSFEQFLLALQDQPVIVGTNFYTSMGSPDSRGVVTPTGALEGGHEYLALGASVKSRYLTFRNSWGKGWGKGGRFLMSFADFERLLSEEGDVTVPVGSHSAA